MQSEAEIERKHRLRAMDDGWFVEKIMQTGRKGFPDRFYLKARRLVLIEWKRFGKKATRQQEIRHEELRRHGAEVYVVDNLSEADRILGLSDLDDSRGSDSNTGAERS